MVMTTVPGDTPQLRPEPGPNDSNPLYPVILATVILCSIFTTVFTAVRLITKQLISTYELEDYMLVMAWVSTRSAANPVPTKKSSAKVKQVASIALDFTLLAAGLAGLGQHAGSWYLRETQFVKVEQYAWAFELLYTPAIWLAKASLLFQLIRIFTPMKSGPVYWACHTLIWGNLAFYISVFFSIIFGCRPIWEAWNPSHKACNNGHMLLVVSSAVNIFSDLLNLLLPIWATWHLQMAPKRKAGIIAIFATGLLAFISSICRLVYTIHIIPNSDDSYTVAQTALWGLAEIATIILCTCFPMMPRFLKLINDRFPSSKPSSLSPIANVRKLKIVKLANAQSSTWISSADPQEEDMAWLKSPYQQLGEGDEASERKGVVRDMGSKRMVDIELASWDQLNAKSRVASMV